MVQRLVPHTTTAEMAARILNSRAESTRRYLLSQRFACRCSSVHARAMKSCRSRQSRLLATRIPGAEFVELDSRNHILMAEESAWARFKDVVLDFAGVTTAAARTRFSLRYPAGSAKSWRP